MKRFVILLASSAAVCALGLWTGNNLDWLVYAHGRIAFTADQTVEHYDSAKQPVGLDKLTVAFRSDGSSVRVVLESRQPGEEGPRGRHVIDLSRREEFSIYPEIQSISSTPLSAESVEVYSRKPDPSCLASDPFRGAPKVELSPDPPTMFGQRVIRMTSERTDSRMKTIFVQWLAPDLDCFCLKRVSTRYDLEGRVLAENVHTVTALRLGEPDEALFERTLGMTERSPSQIRAEIGRMKGRQVVPAEEPGLALQDEAYNRRRGTKK